MACKELKPGKWLVQAQMEGKRRTQRITGNQTDAKAAESQLLAELTAESEKQQARKILGIDEPGPERKGRPQETASPTLQAYFVDRWVDHAKVVQNAITRRTSRVPFNYLLHYLGDKTLDELLQPKTINWFIEQMKINGSMTFTLRRDGKPIKPKVAELTNATINKSLQCLRALLNLACKEGAVSMPPRIDPLPEEDSQPVLPPTEDEYRRILATCAEFQDRAPLIRQVIELAANTGMRRSELFMLTWRSIDLQRQAIRVEQQQKGRVVNGLAWRPKHGKFREIPMNKTVLAILTDLQTTVPHRPDDLVIPSSGGAPYVRMDRTVEARGKGFYSDVVEAAGLKGKVTFHGLRHLFAVRLLTRSVPITVVSELLGHSDINLTVKRYGRFSSDAQVKWAAVRILDAPGGQRVAAD